MSSGRNFWHWCRVPPDPPKSSHKKLLATGLICTLFTISMFASLVPFYGSMMAGQTSALATSSTALTVASFAEGPYFIQNVTYEPMAEANNSTVRNYEQWMEEIDNASTTLRLLTGSYHRDGDLGNINLNITNFGGQNLTVATVEIYQDSSLFALITGLFTIKAHSIGNIDFQVYNLTELSRREAQESNQINNIQEKNNQTTLNWQPVQYNLVLKNSEGMVLTCDFFIFPTASGTSQT
jgi:hypothetical protein